MKDSYCLMLEQLVSDVESIMEHGMVPVEVPIVVIVMKALVMGVSNWVTEKVINCEEEHRGTSNEENEE
jgi:hypothetical protein